jgi:hypothetical protein
VYDSLLAEKRLSLRPGATGRATFQLDGREGIFEWESRQNAVWRRGRIFLKCPRCSRRCARIYLPLKDSAAACRRCCGLTYHSRAMLNYKNSFWGGRAFGWMFGVTQRDMAYERTDERRAERRAASRHRWAARRDKLVTNEAREH